MVVRISVPIIIGLLIIVLSSPFTMLSNASSSGNLVSNDQILTPQQSTKDSFSEINMDIYAESLEILVGNNAGTFIQVNLLGGNSTLPISFTDLNEAGVVTFGLTMVNQSKITDYWPQPLWKMQDGIILHFYTKGTNGYSQAISKVTPLVDKWSNFLQLQFRPIFGDYNFWTDECYILYYCPSPSGGRISQTIDDFWQDQNITDGLGNIIGQENLMDSPVQLTSLMLIKDDSQESLNEWVVLRSAAWLKTDGIQSIQENYQLSLQYITNSDFIDPHPSANYSQITLEFPYLINIKEIDPSPDNPLSELTGIYNWTLQINYDGFYTTTNYSDISLTFDLNISQLESSPNIVAQTTVNQNIDDGVFNYTCTLTNIGDDDAYNISTFVDLGTKTENETIGLFKSNIYSFDPNLTVFFDWNTTGKIQHTPLEHPLSSAWNYSITGWFTINENGFLYQPVTLYNNSIYEILWEESFENLYYEKDIFTIVHSDLFVLVDDQNYGLNLTIAQLAPSTTISAWWGITNLPTEDDEFLFLEMLVDIDEANFSISLIGDKISVVDVLIEGEQAKGEDLRIPSGESWKAGFFLTYNDRLDHPYFSWANGVVTQLYDDEAVLIAILEAERIAHVGDMVNLTLTLTNIGTCQATNIDIFGYYGTLNSEWEFERINSFGKWSLGSVLQPNQSYTLNISLPANTFIGLVPVFFALNYTTDPSQSGIPFGQYRHIKVMSNLECIMVIPRADTRGKMESNFPVPKLEINSQLEPITNWEQKSKILYTVNITNTGGESTFINLIAIIPDDTFNVISKESNITRNGFILRVKNGETIDHTLDVRYLFAYHIFLPVNETITVSLILELEDPESFILPPVIVQYESSFRIHTTEQPIGGNISPETGGTNTKRRVTSKVVAQTLVASSSSPTTWESYSNGKSGKIEPFTPVTEVIKQVISIVYPIISTNINFIAVIMLIPLVFLSFRELKKRY